jgi:hypothetical protein
MIDAFILQFPIRIAKAHTLLKLGSVEDPHVERKAVLIAKAIFSLIRH